MNRINIGLVLLNKNEAQSLEILLPHINQKDFEKTFAVDGGSTDDSVSIIEKYNIPVLIQKSRGRGEAFKLAFNHAKSENLDALLFFSSDCNEDWNDLAKFREHLENGADIVIASRMMSDSHNEEDDKIFRFRKWGNKTFSWLAYLSFGIGNKRITDPINGYRAITIKAWDQMDIASQGFSVKYETSIRSYKLNLKVAEFPTFEHPRLFGESTATAYRTTVAMLNTYLRNVGK